MDSSNDVKEYIETRMKRFRLVDMRREYSSIIQEAEEQSLSYQDFLIRLLETEEAGKEHRRAQRLLKKAAFEMPATLEDIDYSFNPSLDRGKIESLGELGFLERKENIIIIGPPGVGKTMIATGIGRRACISGRKVLFANVNQLVDHLYSAAAGQQLEETMKRLNRIDLLILDELSYIKMDKERESLFFQIIRQRYERNSLIITTNLPLSRWGDLFTGQIAATAILDRLLHHCHVLSITGDSYRVKGPRMKEEN